MKTIVVTGSGKIPLRRHLPLLEALLGVRVDTRGGQWPAGYLHAASLAA